MRQRRTSLDPWEVTRLPSNTEDRACPGQIPFRVPEQTPEKSDSLVRRCSSVFADTSIATVPFRELTLLLS